MRHWKQQHVEEMRQCHSHKENMGLERANSHFGHISEPNAESSTFQVMTDLFITGQGEMRTGQCNSLNFKYKKSDENMEY